MRTWDPRKTIVWLRLWLCIEEEKAQSQAQAGGVAKVSGSNHHPPPPPRLPLFRILPPFSSLHSVSVARI